MITLTAQINLVSENSENLSISNNNLTGNNISGKISNVVGTKISGSNPFIIGASKIGDGSTLSDNVDYFIGNILSDENGNFPSEYELTISGDNIKILTIEFDSATNRHPQSIIVDGKTILDDDYIFTISFDNPEDINHTIKISNWNAPNYPLVITGIYVGIQINLDYSNLLSLERNINYKENDKLPSYGIISNTGNAEFNDNNGEILDFAEQMLLKSGLKVIIKLNNTLTKTFENVGVFETKEWNYDNNNRVVSVSLKDDLEEWQDINIEGFSYDPQNPSKDLPNNSMADLYKWLHDKTPQKYNMLSFLELDAKTQNLLSIAVVKYPTLESGSLWRQWTKLCEACGLYIYKNNRGKTVCTYVYGS